MKEDKLLIATKMMNTSNFLKKYNPQHLFVSIVVDAELKSISSRVIVSNVTLRDGSFTGILLEFYSVKSLYL